MVTKRLHRAADDGYSNPLVPGLRGTADAERLALAIGAAAKRLEPPGPYESVATEPDLEEATWLAFLLALVGPDAPELQAAVEAARPSWAAGELPGLPEAQQRTAAAYRAWAERAGSQQAAFSGEPGWSPERRFARVFERLALPGFGRAPRFDLLATLGAAGHYDARAPASWSSASRTTRRRSPPSACCCRATRCCSSAARASWPPPARCRWPRWTAASPSSARPAPTRAPWRSTACARR